jgi:hypothetical protein
MRLEITFLTILAGFVVSAPASIEVDGTFLHP